MEYSLDQAAHLIQVALTPVFLLSGIGALLSVFATRLARVSDQLDALTKDGDAPPSEERDAKLRLLRRRSLFLDLAVVLATGGASSTCLSILMLFLFAVSNEVVATLLLLLFGAAIIGTLGSLLAFGTEMVMSNRDIRRRIRLHLPHVRWWHR